MEPHKVQSKVDFGKVGAFGVVGVVTCGVDGFGVDGVVVVGAVFAGTATTVK